MSYVEQQLQNWFISWFFNWINIVPVRFLGRKCFVQALLSSGYTFNDKLEQQGVGLRKIYMHSNPKYFDWMVFELRIFLLLAELRRNEHKCAWPNDLSTSTGSLISQDSLLSCFISSYIWNPRPSAQDLTLLTCFNEISSMMGKLFLFRSLTCSTTLLLGR